ncbi:MAG: single-stranded-DNA-specific exonuclease RecJ [Muribaculaceae bacterium]|nr:single-stranded-DNA-specific exonuclease RecJ [Bacteroidales bacterium]MDD6943907.1 single-stranded-DNA-specific exonuclease RecJ [Bacteroidales bacterium]MDY2732851.1 single-stranded-DNA-specific exonuclease RecJ [Muribaculaceae bacterium]MDY4650126.1 single-stranded-DNA-specific exonuclease RecJ [Muribaculaceae bacterium]MDY5387479.1 single-stranded-DNA-specific exonuclease RecJ [Muribaculaceae bacterium]
MINKWNYQPLTLQQKEEATKMLGKCGGMMPVAELLVRRGVSTPEGAESFFSPSLNDLHDPFLMPDMDKAVTRLNKAMGAKERIMIYGDYDVDGTTAVALVYKYLQNYYSNVEYYIPTRDDEGYGISLKSIDYAAENGVKLIIVLDCGIKAIDEITYAKSKGIDFIICDHHVPDEILPPAVAILNPKMPGTTYPCTHLSGCGVGFKFMQAFAQSNGLGIHNELESMLDLVAVSIASDLVPIVGENRVMALHGLRRLNSNPNLGLRSIIRLCKLTNKDITISEVIFKIGPRINASGRMQSGMETVDLLVSRDLHEAFEKGKDIDQHNRERKEIDKKITEEANALIEEKVRNVNDRRAIVIYSKDWHKGVIGIVASRLTELYYKPAVVLSQSNGIATGSARSVQGFDIYAAVNSARDLLENFGGHTYAVGLSMKEENIKEFTRRFEEYVSTHILPNQLEPHLDIDAEIEFADITPELVSMLKRFNPYGPSNQKPVFCSKNVFDFGTSKLVGKNLEHIKLELEDDSTSHVINAIAFNMAQYFEHIHSHKPIDICYTIEQTKHGNNIDTIQLMIRDIRPSEAKK